MKAPVLIYYLVLFGFAGALAYSFLTLGDRLERQYQLTGRALQQEAQTLARKK